MKTCLVVMAVLVAAAHRADACEPPPCWPGDFLPHTASHVPANVPAIAWRPMHNLTTQTQPNDPAQVAWTDSQGNAIAFTAQTSGDLILLVPSAPLAVGEVYTITDHNACVSPVPVTIPPATTTFTATAIAELPTVLGDVTASTPVMQPLEIATSSGSCSEQIVGQIIDLTLALSTDAAPWQDVFAYSTMIDGAVWDPTSSINATNPIGTSWVGRGTDRVFAQCDNPDGQAGETSGMHVPSIRATIYGSTTSPPATGPGNITFSCGVTDTSPPITDNSDSGCNAAGAQPGLLVLISLGGWLRRRYRRRADA